MIGVSLTLLGTFNIVLQYEAFIGNDIVRSYVA